MAEREDKLVEEIRKLQEQVQRLEERVEALAEKKPKIEEGRIRTFIEGFDEALDGGIPKGHVVLLTGGSGTMKTSMALSMLENNRNKGNRGLYISLEEIKESLLKTMAKLGLGLKDEFIVDIGKLRMEHETVEETRDWFQILKDFIARRLEKNGISIVVIDPLTSLYSLSRLANPRRELFHFFNFLRKSGVTSLLLTEVEPLEEVYPYHEDSLADGIFSLRYKELDGGKVELWLRCNKMRHSNHSRNYFILDHRAGKFSVRPVSTQ